MALSLDPYLEKRVSVDVREEFREEEVALGCLDGP